LKLLFTHLKNTVIIPFVVLFLVSEGFAQSCLDGNYTFSGQSDLNRFSSQNPNCTQIKGNVTIEGDVNSLNAFSKIKRIEGNFQIRNCEELTDLSGLKNVESVGGDLILFQNERIKNFKGLSSIRSVGGLKVDINPSFENFEGLEKITTIEGIVFVNDNQTLQSFKGLDNLKYIGGALNIRYNFNMQNLQGLNRLQEVGSLEVSHNASIENMEGLSDLKTVDGPLSILYNDNLKNVCGLNDLELCVSTLSILNNPRLQNVDGLLNLKKVGKYVWLEFNERLNSINGLENVNHFPVWKLILKNNASLNLCSNTFVCNFLNDGMNNDIEKNASECGSKDRILRACESIEEIEPNLVVEYINNKTITGSKTFESGFEIESNSVIFFSSNIIYKASAAITLNSGFEVKQNARFSAEIGEVVVVNEIPNSCN